MIAADTSVIIDYLQGIDSSYTDLLEHYLDLCQVWIAPVVETELLSDPKPSQPLDIFLEGLLYFELHAGYWQRTGKSRSILKARSLKAKIADALIAQSCIDHNIPLLTRDGDFQHYADYCGLKLALPLDNPH